jgi:acyl carrier protein
VPVALDEIRTLVRLQLGAREARAEDRIVEDLGAESLDIVGILAAVEDRFGVSLDETAIPDIRTVADLHRRVAGLLSS